MSGELSIEAVVPAAVAGIEATAVPETVTVQEQNNSNTAEPGQPKIRSKLRLGAIVFALCVS